MWINVSAVFLVAAFALVGCNANQTLSSSAGGAYGGIVNPVRDAQNQTGIGGR